MANIKRILMVWKYQTTLLLQGKKLYLVVIMLFLFIRSNLEPVRHFSHAVGIGATPYTFAILMNGMLFPVIVLLGFLFLICDAPFIQQGYLFLVARSGKIMWGMGECLFLFTTSFFYAIMVYFFSVINLAPNIEWNSEWGKAILTLMRTDASNQFNVNDWNPVVVNNYTALEANLKTFLLLLLLLWGISILVFGINYICKNHFGIVFGILVIFFDLALYNLFSVQYYKFSLVSLMKLSVITGVDRWSPTFSYALLFLGGVCMAGMVLITLMLKLKKGIRLEDRRRQ